MRLVRRFVVGTAFALCVTGSMEAQSDAMPAAWLLHRGFIGSLSVGLGSGGVGMSGTARPDIGTADVNYTVADVSYDLFLGFAVNRRVRIGAQVDVLNHSAPTAPIGAQGSAERSVFYTAAVAFYPTETSSFWAKVNLGYGTIQLQSYAVGFVNPNAATLALTGSGGGFAAGLGAGYDWRPRGGALLVIPYATYLMQAPSVSFSGGFLSGNATASLIQVGVGLGYNR